MEKLSEILNENQTRDHSTTRFKFLQDLEIFGDYFWPFVNCLRLPFLKFSVEGGLSMVKRHFNSFSHIVRYGDRRFYQ